MKKILLIFALVVSLPALANDAAIRISEGAALTGTRVLIIGFEGLAGFNSAGSNQASVYQCQLSHGMPARKPGGIGGQVLGALAIPVIEKYKNQVKVLMFAHDACTGSGTLPEEIAAQWMADANKSEATNGRRVIILGHSFGGDAAVILGRSLAARGVKVDSVFTMDPRKRPIGTGGFKAAGSARWVNFYQKFDFLLMGWEIAGAENNFLLASPLMGHLVLPHHPKILPALMAQIGEPPGEKVLADGGKIPGQEKTNTAGKNICSTEMLGEAGIYRGTSGMIEAIPIAAVVGGGGYLAYQALSGKGGSGGKGGGGGKKNKGSNITATSVGDATITDSTKSGDKKVNSKTEQNLKNTETRNSINIKSSFDYDPNANRARSRLVSDSSDKEMAPASPIVSVPIRSTASRSTSSSELNPVQIALNEKKNESKEAELKSNANLIETAASSSPDAEKEKSEEESKKETNNSSSKEDPSELNTESGRVSEIHSENASVSSQNILEFENLFSRVSRKIKMRMR